VGKIAGRGKDVKSTEQIPRIDTRLQIDQVSVRNEENTVGGGGLESGNEQARRGEGLEVVREGRSEEEGKRRGGGTENAKLLFG
jgi:hypothetical protein